jgi:hypothetical protein
LLGRELSPEQVAARAVALGLVRQPGPGAALLLPAQAVARLFLAGYGVPAAVEASTLRCLHEHGRAGRLTFLLLPAVGNGCVNPFELLQTHQHEDGRVSVCEPGRPSALARELSPEEFAAGWSDAGHFLIAALRSWSELPTEGSEFFGGSRDRDGSYYWYAAECETDSAGRILRYG